MRFGLQRVRYMPKELNPGVLYVSKEFGIAIHLCACGCGAKVRTPLGQTEWSLKAGPNGPSLYPSVGNWQESCRSHYWITDGEIVWAGRWTPQEVLEGSLREEERRRAYFDAVYRKGRGPLSRLWRVISGLLGR